MKICLHSRSKFNFDNLPTTTYVFYPVWSSWLVSYGHLIFKSGAKSKNWRCGSINSYIGNIHYHSSWMNWNKNETIL